MKINNIPTDPLLRILCRCALTNTKVTKTIFQILKVRICYTVKINLGFYSENLHKGILSGEFWKGRLCPAGGDLCQGGFCPIPLNILQVILMFSRLW